MKLKHFILGAVALTGALSMTSCEDKNDKDNLNIYTAWKLENTDEDSRVENLYLIFDKDSVGTYFRFSNEVCKASGLSHDTVYITLGPKAEVLSPAVCNEDSARIYCADGDGIMKYVVKKIGNSYIMIQTLPDGISDTINVVPEPDTKWTDRKYWITSSSSEVEVVEGDEVGVQVE